MSTLLLIPSQIQWTQNGDTAFSCHMTSYRLLHTCSCMHRKLGKRNNLFSRVKSVGKVGGFAVVLKSNDVITTQLFSDYAAPQRPEKLKRFFKGGLRKFPDSSVDYSLLNKKLFDVRVSSPVLDHLLELIL